MKNLHRIPLAEQLDLIRSHNLNPEEVLEHYLERQNRLNPVLHSFSILEHERARQDLARLSSIEHKGALFGTISADKDLDRRLGSPNLRGSITTSWDPATHSDQVTLAADNSGIISTGRTQVPEFGLSGNAQTRQEFVAVNPWNTTLDPGGSSAGAAAAVAAGLIPVAIASDAGGSIRIPAASCGVVGFKPGRQYLPYDGQFAMNRNSVHGTIARTVQDATLLLEGLGAPDQNLTYSLGETIPPLRIAATTYTPWFETLEISLPDEILAAFDAAVAALTDLGHTVVRTDLSEFCGYAESFNRLWQTSAASIVVPVEEEENLYFFTRWLREQGRSLSPEQVAADITVMEQFEHFFDEQTAEYDLVLTPAMGLLPQTTAWHREPDPRHNFEKQCQYSPYSSYVNMIGRPAITVPVSAGVESTFNIPMSVQLIAPQRGEIVMAQVAHQLEHNVGLNIPYPFDT